MENKLATAQKKKKSLIEPVKFEDFGKLKDLETFKIFKYIKFLLIGLVFGTALPVGVYVMKYLLDGKLKDDNYITNAYKITKLACIHSSDCSKTDSTAVEALESNINLLIGKGNKSIIFVSTLSGINDNKLTELKSLIEKYNSNGVTVKLVSPCSVQEIDSAGVVILAERLDVSDFNKTIDEVKNVLALKEHIYGIVYV